ncbi:MAG: hypothetical protein JNK67_15685 [Alphaproteobacteria bacterium]|nr:hypothetical protein [Alphaproteobacteria bacterium]
MSLLTPRNSQSDIARRFAALRRDVDALVSDVGEALARQVSGLAKDGIGEVGRHAGDVPLLIRRNPETVAMLALGIGVLLGCWLGMRERSN